MVSMYVSVLFCSKSFVFYIFYYTGVLLLWFILMIFNVCSLSASFIVNLSKLPCSEPFPVWCLGQDMLKIKVLGYQ